MIYNIYIYQLNKFVKEGLTKVKLWNYANVNFNMKHLNLTKDEQLTLFDAREDLFKTVMLNEKNIPKTFIALNDDIRKKEMKKIPVKFFEDNNTILSLLCEEYEYKKDKILPVLYEDIRKLSKSKKIPKLLKIKKNQTDVFCNYYKTIYDIFPTGLNNFTVIKRGPFNVLFGTMGRYENFTDLSKDYNIIIIKKTLGVYNPKEYVYIDKVYKFINLENEGNFEKIKIYYDESKSTKKGGLLIMRLDKDLFEILGNKWNRVWTFNNNYDNMVDKWVLNNLINVNYTQQTFSSKNFTNLQNKIVLHDKDFEKIIKKIDKTEINIGENIENYIDRVYGELKEYCIKNYLDVYLKGANNKILKKVLNRKFEKLKTQLSMRFRHFMQFTDKRKPEWEKEVFETIKNDDFLDLIKMFVNQANINHL